LKLFFDTSALVPVFYADHPDHDASAQAFLAAPKSQTFCGLHSLGELYAVLTGLPLRPRIRGSVGAEIVRQVRERLTVVSLSEQEYVAAIEAVQESIVGGAVHDAIIAAAAVKCGAEVLLTWNLRDFQRLPLPNANLVKTPRQFLDLLAGR
jgi:predicted nucleic acid-binding protein